MDDELLHDENNVDLTYSSHVRTHSLTSDFFEIEYVHSERCTRPNDAS